MEKEYVFLLQGILQRHIKDEQGSMDSEFCLTSLNQLQRLKISPKILYETDILKVLEEVKNSKLVQKPVRLRSAILFFGWSKLVTEDEEMRCISDVAAAQFTERRESAKNEQQRQGKRSTIDETPEKNPLKRSASFSGFKTASGRFSMGSALKYCGTKSRRSPIKKTRMADQLSETDSEESEFEEDDSGQVGRQIEHGSRQGDRNQGQSSGQGDRETNRERSEEVKVPQDSSVCCRVSEEIMKQLKKKISKNKTVKKELKSVQKKLYSTQQELDSIKKELDSIKKELAALKDGYECNMCQDEVKSHFYNCGHTFCAKCIVKNKRCPFCREKVSEYYKLFL